MNIAIVGATSFLAQNCVKMLLEEGHSIVLYGRSHGEAKIDSENVAFKSLNIHDDDFHEFVSQLKRFDFVLYCLGAGIQPNSSVPLEDIWLLNAFTPIKLIEHLALENYEGTFLTFGSYFEIGELNEVRLLDEEAFLANRSPLPNAYCLSKKTFTSYVSNRLMSGLPFSHLHCILTNIYGVGENPNRLIPYIFRKVYAREPLQFSSGTQQRQYTHIDDVVSWVCRVIAAGDVQGGVYNVTDESVCSVKEVIQKSLSFLSSAGYEVSNVSFNDATKRDRSMSFLGLSSRKAKEMLNWEAEKSLETGIAEYYEKK